VIDVVDQRWPTVATAVALAYDAQEAKLGEYGDTAADLVYPHA
jgi:hypothetical protein